MNYGRLNASLDRIEAIFTHGSKECDRSSVTQMDLIDVEEK